MAQTKIHGGVQISQGLTGSLTHVTLSFNSINVSGRLAVGGAVEKALELIAGAGFNPVIIGTPFDLNATADAMHVALEGTFGTDTYDGTNAETVAAHLEDILTAVAATIDGVDFSAILVTAFVY
jgi:hypothetical protein